MARLDKFREDFFTKRWNLLFITFIVGIFGLILRFYLGALLPTSWDAGHYLYWGKFVLDGKIPFKDFFARHPLYIYLIALSMKIFGYDIFAAIMVSVIASFLTIFILYKISSMLYDKKTGLIACIIYAFAPTILTYSTVPDEKSITLLFLSIAILILIQALKAQNPRFFMLFGGILGFSIAAYKAVAIYLLTAPLLLAYVNTQAEIRITYVLKKTLIQLMYMVIGFCIPVLTIYAYYGLMTNFQWAAYAFLGLGSQSESVGYFMWGEIAPLTFKFRIFHVAIREWLYLAVPTAIFMGVLIERTFKNSNYIKRFLIYLLGISFLVILLIGEHYWPQTTYGAYEPDTIYKNSFLFTLILLVVTYSLLFSKVNSKVKVRVLLKTCRFSIVTSSLPFSKVTEKFNDIAKIKHGNAVIAYWFLSTSFLIALYGVPLVNYYYWLAPVMTIMAAVLLRIILTNFSVREGSNKSNKTEHEVILRADALFILFIVISAAGITAGMLMSTPMTWRNQSITTLHEVADYIREHTSENEEILTDNPAVALLANRRVALNVMPYLLYAKVGPEPYDPLPYDPFNLIPNTHEIAEYMKSGNVRYVVDTAYLRDVIRLHSEWNQTFKSRYVLEKKIGGVLIYVFKR